MVIKVNLMDSQTPNFDIWDADSVIWLESRLSDLGWTPRDLDIALGYTKSRGAYTTMILRHGQQPSRRYRRALAHWAASNPRPANLLQLIQAAAVPWLRAREGQPAPNRTYSRRQAHIIRSRRHASQ